MKTVAIIYGTRPEAIKIAPLARALAAHPQLRPYLVSTGQHGQTLRTIENWFGITPDVTLDVLRTGQSLNELVAKVITQVEQMLQRVQPDAVVVQGDTTTVLGAALACFYHESRRIPVVHLEAGLRSGDLFSPYPEEANRLMVTQVASLLLAPTQCSRRNLLNEAKPDAHIAVTGNTVVDALMYTVSQPSVEWEPPLGELVASGRRFILVTCHRRENWGEPMVRVARGLKAIAERHRDLAFVLPLHVNPAVQAIFRAELGDHEQFLLTDALDYPQFSQLMAKAHFVISDSGGVQEEAPSLGKPVLVLRENTERPEARDAGTVTLVGTDPKVIAERAEELLSNEEAYAAMSSRANPYGTGDAAPRCVDAIARLLGVEA